MILSKKRMQKRLIGNFLIFIVLIILGFAGFKLTSAEASGWSYFSRNFFFSLSLNDGYRAQKTKVAESGANNNPRTYSNNVAQSNGSNINPTFNSQNSGAGMVTLSFDDGWKSQYEKILPILSESGIKGTFYIITDTLIPGRYRNYMTKEDVIDLYKKGHEIGSHTIGHIDLTKASTTEAKRQITESKQILEEMLQNKVDTFAYPFGAYNPEVTQMIKDAGYTNARTVNRNSLNGKDENVYLLKAMSLKSGATIEEIKSQIDTAIKNDTWLVITFHEIDAPSDRIYTNSSDFIKEIIKYIKEKKVQTVTISEGVAKLNGTSPTNTPPPVEAPAQEEDAINIEVNLNLSGENVYATSSTANSQNGASINIYTEASSQNSSNPTVNNSEIKISTPENSSESGGEGSGGGQINIQ